MVEKNLCPVSSLVYTMCLGVQNSMGAEINTHKLNREFVAYTYSYKGLMEGYEFYQQSVHIN